MRTVDTIGAILIAAFVVFLFAFIVGTINGRMQIRTEAAKLGHAEYVPDEHGNPTFRWRDKSAE